MLRNLENLGIRVFSTNFIPVLTEQNNKDKLRWLFEKTEMSWQGRSLVITFTRMLGVDECGSMLTKIVENIAVMK